MLRRIVVTAEQAHAARAKSLAEKLEVPWVQLPGDISTPYYLKLSDRGLELCHLNERAAGPVRCDFIGGAPNHRRRFGGGRRQDLSRAAGLHRKYCPTILDITAGLGRDAFVFASLGSKVTMLERHPVVYALLRDGLCRARQYAERQDAELLDILARMSLKSMDSFDYLRLLKEDEFPDVIYLDPMYPPRVKSAKVKKEMAVFHQLVGGDEDAGKLLEMGLTRARYRLVVKRPAHTGPLAQKTPSYSLPGKSTRFDIYAFRALPGRMVKGAAFP